MDCSFCGKLIPRGTGIMFVRKTGQVYTFCSRKCEHNQIHLGRQSRKTQWTKDYAKTKTSNIAIRAHEASKHTADATAKK